MDLGLQLGLQACHGHGTGVREEGQLLQGQRWELAGSAVSRGVLAAHTKVINRFNSLSKNGGVTDRRGREGDRRRAVRWRDLTKVLLEEGASSKA